MVDSLDLDVTANGYPKDRAMLVTFQGSHGFGIEKINKTMDYQYYSWFGYKLTSTGLTNDQAKLYTAINAIAPLGATPTIDGLTLAQEDYAGALDPANVYDAQFYLEDGEPVQRQTIYFLITDGVANSGLYDNFPAGTKPIDEALLRPIDRSRSYTWVYESIGKTYFETYWNDPGTTETAYTYKNASGQDEFYRTFTDELGKVWFLKNPETTSPDPYMMYILTSSGTIAMSAYTYDPWEHYTLMMESMKIKAQELKTTGGLPNLSGEPMADATFVSAYWEDLPRFVAGNLRGITYRPTVRPLVTDAMREMASSDDLYISHNEGADFAEFQQNLIEGFIQSQNVNGRFFITLDPNVSFIEDSIVLYHLGDGGTETEIELEYILDADKRVLTISLEKLPKGRYRIDYRMVEGSYLKDSYFPVEEIKIMCDGGDITLDTESGVLKQIDGFEHPPCEIVPTPTVPPTLPDTGFPSGASCPSSPTDLACP